MTVKLILLKTGETLVSDAKEVIQEEQTRGYLLKEPQIVDSHEKTMLMEADTGKGNYESVSYTHLTLPTILRV